MAKLKEAMKKAKATRKPQRVTEPSAIGAVKVSTSIRLDLEVISWFKLEADRQGIGYQTLINSALIQHVKNGSLENRLEAIEKALKIKVG